MSAEGCNKNQTARQTVTNFLRDETPMQYSSSTRVNRMPEVCQFTLLFPVVWHIENKAPIPFIYFILNNMNPQNKQPFIHTTKQ